MATNMIINNARLSVALMIGVGTSQVMGMEVHVLPRVNMGFAHYELNYDPAITGTGPGAGSSVSGFTIEDNMPMVNGGFTIFVDKFYADFSASNAFNGSANSDLNAVLPARIFGPTFQSTTNVNFQSNIDRIEYAFTAGYRVTPKWSLYAGYRNTETSIAQSIDGTVRTSDLRTNQLTLLGSGPLNANADLSFDNDGPFVGTTYSWDFSDTAIPGTLSGNLAVAFLDGASKTRFQNILFNGRPIPVDNTILPILRRDLSGNTVGLSIGLNWRGTTPIRGLSYLAGMSGYRYEFDNDIPKGQAFDETMIRFDLGLGYAFQF